MVYKSKYLNFVDDDDGFNSDLKENEQILGDELIYQDSDDDLPVIVNENEILDELNRRGGDLGVDERSKSLSPPRKTIDYKHENDDDDEVVYRNKYGKRITRDEWLLLNQKDKKKKEYPKQELTWGKGLVQKEEEEQKHLEEQNIMNESFQRYDIDEGYDKMLRSKIHKNDPMLNISKDENYFKDGSEDFKTDEEEVDEVPKCRFNMIPNRFNIEPGYRWDGVIRGNNYEQRWFQARCNNIEKEKKGYLQNIADL